MNDDRNGTGRLSRLRRWAGAVKQDVVALYIAARDPRVPWHVKLAATAIAAYALSPIDPIPDFIPVLGYLDELILLPIAIFFVIKMIPDPLMQEFRAEAQRRSERPVSRVAAAVIIGLWIAAAAFLLWAFWPTPAPHTPSQTARHANYCPDTPSHSTWIDAA
jgi:uncharacterized membrane protein YkvA (DUF1232 family)